MKLLTKEVRAELPPLYTQEKNEDPTVYVLCSAEHKTCYASAAVMLCRSARLRKHLWPVFFVAE